jgi:hypothetical protein
MNWDVFWSVLFVMFIVIPLFMIWFFAIADLFMRPDLRGITKVLWLFGIIFFPFIGTVVYYLTRPAVVVARGEQPAYVAETLTRLKVLHDSGDLSDADYDKQRTRLLMAS